MNFFLYRINSYVGLNRSFVFKGGVIHDEQQVDNALKEYLDNISIENAKKLKKELSSNIEFSNTFKKMLNLLGQINGAFMIGEQDTINEMTLAFINEPLNINPYIQDMASFYLTSEAIREAFLTIEKPFKRYSLEEINKHFDSLLEKLQRPSLKFKLDNELPNIESHNTIIKV